MSKQLLIVLLIIAALVQAAEPAATPAKPKVSAKPVFEPKVEWEQNFAAAQAQAKKEGKPILALFTGSDWCPWCIKLQKEVFSKPQFQTYAKENLVLFIADFPRSGTQSAGLKTQNQKLQSQYQIEGYPTVVLLKADASVVAKTGYRKGGAAAYVTHLKSLLDAK
ncbi:MAG: thioredoxin family protein [Victivallales bacterium]|nr:thioredoxin family protein [Victivallales bacterium]